MTEAFTFEDLPPIEGRPELTWPGKRPLRSATWRPSRLKESYGFANDGWMNRLYCGDNLQVMTHLLGEFRGKVDLVYIDPPFGSNASYASRIHPKGRPAYPLLFTFAERRFGDVWARGEYLQFMYERLILIREFQPKNLIRRLGLSPDFFEDWRHLADSVFIDWNYNGEVFRPLVVDVPTGDDLVEGSYAIPEYAGIIRIRVVDVLLEAFEVDVRA